MRVALGLVLARLELGGEPRLWPDSVLEESGGLDAHAAGGLVGGVDRGELAVKLGKRSG